MKPEFAVRLKKGCEKAVQDGMPWIYAGDLNESSEYLLIEPGSLVTVQNHKGQFVATGYFNGTSAIAARVLTLKDEPITAQFFVQRLKNALARRERFPEPYYRFVHSEADNLPGLLIDRFGDAVVVQVGTAGMEKLQPLWLEALEEVIAPKIIVLRNDIPAREREGLIQEVKIIPSPLVGEGWGEGASFKRDPLPLTPSHKGRENYIVEVHENGFVYFADLLKGQKTGWFYDQRDNRQMIAAHAKGKTLLDLYSHSGGFGLLAAKAGATVTLVDSSQLALDLAKKSAISSKIEKSCTVLRTDVVEAMQKADQQYDIVLADPPAFVKSRKDIVAGMKGYEKIARLAAGLVAPDGLLFVASCSHHAARASFNKAVLAGVEKAGRKATIEKQTGASADHPRHPRLPQSEYLKGLLLKLN